MAISARRNDPDADSLGPGPFARARRFRSSEFRTPLGLRVAVIAVGGFAALYVAVVVWSLLRG